MKNGRMEERKEMERKPVLTLMVETFPEKTVEMDFGTGHVKMIPFSGRAEGELFHGIIEPCGVDTQVTNAANVRHMSARYMLTGQDYTGQSCHIYIENNAWFTDGSCPRPWVSVPTFLTDSEALKPILHAQRFTGEGMRVEEGLRICYYQTD